jgi:XTP/dITP diphosphohydrolase
MTRKLEPGKLVLATHNDGKLSEMRDLIGPFGFEVTSAGELGLAEPPEHGTTFEENARTKAVAAMQATGLPALSDDSGLCVDALGRPAGRSHRRLGRVARRRPRLRHGHAQCRGEAAGERRHRSEGARGPFRLGALSRFPDGHVEYFRGEVEGTLVWPPRGTSSASATIRFSGRTATTSPSAR